MSVYVLVYSHRHGIDASVYATQGDAERAACDIVLSCLDEVDKATTKLAIVEAMASGRYGDAILLYCAAAGEDMDLSESECFSFEGPALKRDIEAALASARAEVANASSEGEAP
jgi:hypothetical protein